MGSVPVATSFLSIFYIYSTFFGRIKALWGANPPFRGHNPAIFANRLTLFDGLGLKALARYRTEGSVASSRVRREEVLELVRNALPVLGIGRGFFFDRDICPGF
jgi:hypothetical protein